MSQACPGNTPLSQLLQHPPKHPRARHPHPWQGTLPEGSRHAGCSAWRDLRAFSSLPRQAQLGQTQHLAREKLPANFSLRLSTQAAAAAQPLCKAGQRRGEGCGTTAHCRLKTPEWRAGAATLTGAGANPSPWLSDGARTNCSSQRDLLPDPGGAHRTPVLPRGISEAVNLQEDLRSFTHFRTVLELVHLGLQRAIAEQASLCKRCSQESLLRLFPIMVPSPACCLLQNCDPGMGCLPCCACNLQSLLWGWVPGVGAQQGQFSRAWTQTCTGSSKQCLSPCVRGKPPKGRKGALRIMKGAEVA